MTVSELQTALDAKFPNGVTVTVGIGQAIPRSFVTSRLIAINESTVFADAAFVSGPGTFLTLPEGVDWKAEGSVNLPKAVGGVDARLTPLVVPVLQRLANSLKEQRDDKLNDQFAELIRTTYANTVPQEGAA